jgi:hypothetical protein
MNKPENKPEASKPEAPKTEVVAPTGPTPLPEVKQNDRSRFVIAMAQEGMPLNEFWRNPSEAALNRATIRVVRAMAAKGSEDSAILSNLNLMSAANSSALRQVFESKATLPSGVAKTAASIALPDLAVFKLPS